jgi:hypothetical protein
MADPRPWLLSTISIAQAAGHSLPHARGTQAQGSAGPYSEKYGMAQDKNWTEV